MDANGVNTCLLRGQITTLKAGGGAKILMVPHVSVILPYYEGENGYYKVWVVSFPRTIYLLR